MADLVTGSLLARSRLSLLVYCTGYSVHTIPPSNLARRLGCLLLLSLLLGPRIAYAYLPEWAGAGRMCLFECMEASPRPRLGKW